MPADSTATGGRTEAADAAVTAERPGASHDPARGLTGHVIVCGLGDLGLSIVEQLHFSGVGVIVVDERPDPRLLGALGLWSVSFLEGSPRSTRVLQAAGVMRARAVICVIDDDLRTLEVALTAHNLRPGLRVVVQMANAAVARALTEVTGPGSALDVADLASPAVVQACLGQNDHELVLAGTRFAAVEVTARAAGTLRSLYGDLVPIAVVPAGGSTVDICPGRDRVVEAGDRVTVLGAPAELEALTGWLPPAVTFERHRRLHQLAHLPSALWSRAGRGLHVTLSGLVGLVLASAVLIRFCYQPSGGGHLSFLTSLYFTVETVATVGFGDFSFAAQSAWMRVFAIVLIILGVSLVTTTFALLTNVLVSRSLAAALGRSRAVRMRGHVVVVGLGSIGVRVVERLLGLGRPVVVVERDENNRHLAQVRALRVPVVIGNGTLPATLDEANVKAASSVAVLTSSDLTNLETALSLGDYLARAGVEPPVILRLFDRSLAQTVSESFGLSHVLPTSALAAPWFVGAALGLDILLTFAIERERFLVARLTVAPSGGLAGLSMQELSARIRVVALRRAENHELEHPPRRGTRFAPGDEAFLIGPYEELLTVLRRDAGGGPA